MLPNQEEISMPEGWHEYPNRLQQRDSEARLSQKNGINHYGAPRKITGYDLGSSIPGRQGHEYHGKATHGSEFFVVPTAIRTISVLMWNMVLSGAML